MDWLIASWWSIRDTHLEKTFHFRNFVDAIEYMNDVAPICEAMQHHPDWRNIYNTLHVSLTTHDAGNTITEKDILLAGKMDEIFLEYKN